jgi:hypothetical protein
MIKCTTKNIIIRSKSMVNYNYTKVKATKKIDVVIPNKEFLKLLTATGFMDMISNFYSFILESFSKHIVNYENDINMKIIKEECRW